MHTCFDDDQIEHRQQVQASQPLRETNFLSLQTCVLVQQVGQAAGKLVKGQQQATRSHPYHTLLQLYLIRFPPRAGDARQGSPCLPTCIASFCNVDMHNLKPNILPDMHSRQFPCLHSCRAWSYCKLVAARGKSKGSLFLVLNCHRICLLPCP